MNLVSAAAISHNINQDTWVPGVHKERLTLLIFIILTNTIFPTKLFYLYMGKQAINLQKKNL